MTARDGIRKVRALFSLGRFAIASLLVVAVGSLSCCALLGQIGGASSHAPSERRTGLSAAAHALLDRVHADLDPPRMVDYHVHIAGLGTGGSGCRVHPKMFSWLHPWHRIQVLVYLDAAGVHDFERADEEYVARLVDLVRSNERHGRYGLLAFDETYGADGRVDADRTEFHVPNDYVLALADRDPDLFVPIASIHPRRPDALRELERCAARGVRIVKWLPNAMGIDPADPSCDPFYARMKVLGIALLTHAGDEQAVDARDAQELGNPLRLRRALDAGVRVIVAHCASLGRGLDLDDPARVEVDNFDLFLRLMEEPRYAGLLFGEISAVCQRNRPTAVLATLLERNDLHARLVNGSDYPLPAINVLFSTRRLESAGFLNAQERELLKEIYEYDPLLFDLALKRTVHHPRSGARFPASVFEEQVVPVAPRAAGSQSTK